MDFGELKYALIGPDPVPKADLPPGEPPAAGLTLIAIGVLDTHDPHLVILPLLGVSGHDGGGLAVGDEVDHLSVRDVKGRAVLRHPAGEEGPDRGRAAKVVEGGVGSEQRREGGHVLCVDGRTVSGGEIGKRMPRFEAIDSSLKLVQGDLP